MGSHDSFRVIMAERIVLFIYLYVIQILKKAKLAELKKSKNKFSRMKEV